MHAFFTRGTSVSAHVPGDAVLQHACNAAMTARSHAFTTGKNLAACSWMHLRSARVDGQGSS